MGYISEGTIEFNYFGIISIRDYLLKLLFNFFEVQEKWQD